MLGMAYFGLAVPPADSGDRRIDLPGAFAKMRAAREAKKKLPTPGEGLEPPPIFDLAGTAAAARAAAERARIKAAGANKPAPAQRSATPRSRRAVMLPGLTLNPAPGPWRMY